MRRVRPLFLIAILSIGGYLGYTYRQRIADIRRNAPAAPKKLPDGVSATAEYWEWEKSSGDGPKVRVRAKEFRQIREPSQFELEKVELKIYHKDGKAYDNVTSERAVFDIAAGSLYSEGEANITMGVPEGEEPSGNKLIRIRSSGIRFDSRSGKAETDREASFLFEKGEGKAVGANYDPATRELLLRSKAELIWQDKGPNPRPMKVESNEVIYKERESKVLLSPWAKLTRGTLSMDSKAATVTLDKNGIRVVETTEATGVDRQPGRLLEFAAKQLTMNFNEKSEIEHILGNGDAKLVTTTDTALTTTNTQTIDLLFEAQRNESVLKRALATGKTVVESKPIPKAGRLLAETRVLRSEVVEMKMREDGKSLDTMDTPSAGILEFFPNRPGQKKRRVDGERFHVVYGAANQVESFRAMQARTQTENEPKRGKPVPPAITTSKELQALFAPQSGEMTRLEQWGDFHYEEGDRKARAERALLDSATNRITLVQSARVWDSTGSTNGDEIVLDQKTEDFQASGNVQSSRLPDQKSSGSTMISKQEPMQAKAERMRTSDQQSTVVYDGNALLWQGSSRLQADHIEIDRKNSVVRANGKVVSQLLDQKKPDPKGKAKSQPTYTLVHAPALIYSDKDRIAHYTGGAFLRREETDVKAHEIRAFLKEEKKGDEKKEDESSLDKALADGNVVIVQTTPGRTRKGMSEHAEYYVDEAKILLRGGHPTFEDSVKGNTAGQELIYFSNEDKLLVNGSLSAPAKSKVRRKPDANSANKRTQ